ncbi:MAG: hypothetical protein Q4G58_01020 [bacterium]|nr:hypothetical protein [bacterium]
MVSVFDLEVMPLSGGQGTDRLKALYLLYPYKFSKKHNIDFIGILGYYGGSGFKQFY